MGNPKINVGISENEAFVPKLGVFAKMAEFLGKLIFQKPNTVQIRLIAYFNRNSHFSIGVSYSEYKELTEMAKSAIFAKEMADF